MALQLCRVRQGTVSVPKIEADADQVAAIAGLLIILCGGPPNSHRWSSVWWLRRSGGGGGTRGPAVVDKRNVELECPHCDRTFKQVLFSSAVLIYPLTVPSLNIRHGTCPVSAGPALQGAHTEEACSSYGG